MGMKSITSGEVLARYVRTISMMFCLSMLAACSATGPLFSEAGPISSGKGRLYVFRPDLRYMGVVRAEFRVDAVPAMQLDNNGYSFVDLTPGPHVVAQEWGKKFYTTGAIVNKPVFLAVNVEAGKSSYVMLSSQVQQHSDGVTREIRYGWRLSELSTAEGRRLIDQTRYQPAVSATASTTD